MHPSHAVRGGMTAPVLRLDSAVYAPGTRHVAHSHGELHLSLVLRGRIAERVGSETEYAGALSVVVKDPAVTHANNFGEAGAVMARLSVADRGFADLVDDRARAADWHWTHDASVAAPFLRVVARAQRGENGFAMDDGDIVDLVAALTARPVADPIGVPPAWLRSAVEQMRDGWHPALTVRDVAAAVGVHPVYLARCVRRWYGRAAAEELRRSRLSRAAGELAQTATTVSTTAHSMGFSDEAHMCREFSRATGVTPGRYRRLARTVEQFAP